MSPRCSIRKHRRAPLPAHSTKRRDKRAAAGREVRAAGYNFAASAIRKSFTHRPAHPNKLTTELYPSGRAVPLIAFNARQTKKGVRVRIRGASKLYAHSFIATMKSGHRGVFLRAGEGHKRVIKDGKAR